MRKFIFKMLVAVTLVFSVGVSISPSIVEAGSYYYDKSTGNYVINASTSLSGNNLNKSLPGSVARQMKNAAIKKYGSIQGNRTYTFKYKNIVNPYKTKYGYSFSYSGRVTGVICTGRK